MSFPDKEARAKCWGTRDKYWACLADAERAGKSTDTCKELRKIYESSCPSQWVKHFDRKRTYEKFKEKLEKDGYDPLDSKKDTKNK